MKRFQLIATIVLMLACHCGTAAASDEFVATVTLSPYEVRVGDPITVTYTITALNVNSIRLDPLPETISDATVLNVTDQFSENLIGAKLYVRALTLVPFSVEDLAIPQLGVQIINEQGQSVIGLTPRTIVHVRSVATGEGGPEAMKSLKGIDTLPEESHWLFIWLIIGSVLVIAALFAWFMLRKRTPSSIQELIKLSPAQRAIKDLSELINSGLLNNGKYNEFFTKLADIIRRYLGLRYHILALEMTTKELCIRMTRSWQTDDPKNKSLSTLLSACDLVKFAKFIPPTEQGEDGIETAEQIVQSTRDDNLHESLASEDKPEGS